MFAQYTEKAPPPTRLVGFAFFSFALHASVVAALLFLVPTKVKEEVARQVAVTFQHAVAASARPPPPPPPAARKSTPKTATPKKPQQLVVPQQVKPVEQLPQKEVDDEPAGEPEQAGGQVGGVPGGVEGGVVGGVVGGQLGGQVGSTGEVVKPKNVPAFAIQRDAVRQLNPRLSEVFKNAHRGQTVMGMYKICVGTDGRVFDVQAVKSIPGADEDIINDVRAGWEFKPQKVPVCFLWNMVVKPE